jgi:hypothetical protein
MKATAFSLSILLATSSLAFGTAKLVGAHRGRADVQRFGFAYPPTAHRRHRGGRRHAAAATGS